MADIPTVPPPPDGRPTHPLKNWRQTQRMLDHRTREPRPWTVADAARSFSAFVGQEVPYHTWMAWERYEDEDGSRRPNSSYMEQLFLFTRGAIRPNDFYPVGEWRKLLADEAAARAAEAGASADRSGRAASLESALPHVGGA